MLKRYLFIFCLWLPLMGEAGHKYRAVESLSCPLDIAWRAGNIDFWATISEEFYWENIVKPKGLFHYADLIVPKRLATALGLDGSPRPESVVELGGNWGRVCQALAEFTDIPHIEVVEANPRQAAFLRKFGDKDSLMKEIRAHGSYVQKAGSRLFLPPDEERGTVKRTSVQEFYINEENVVSWVPQSNVEPQVALFLFAGIMELSNEEKNLFIRHMHQHLHPRALLAVDVPVGRVNSQIKTEFSAEMAKQEVFYFLREGNRLNWHPVRHDTMEVNVDRLKKILTQDNLFQFIDEEIYVVPSENTPKRRMLYFKNNRKT